MEISASWSTRNDWMIDEREPGPFSHIFTTKHENRLKVGMSVDVWRLSSLTSAFGGKADHAGMSAFDAVDGASSAASKWYRMIASKPERFKEVMPGNEMAFEVFKQLARTRRRNADTVDPGIGRTRLGQRTLKCVFLIGTRSAHSIRASGLTAAQT